jgi:hypothetical protein
VSSETFQHTRAIKEQTDAIKRLAKAIEHANELKLEELRDRRAMNEITLGRSLTEHYMGVPRDIKDD